MDTKMLAEPHRLRVWRSILALAAIVAPLVAGCGGGGGTISPDGGPGSSGTGGALNTGLAGSGGGVAGARGGAAGVGNGGAGVGNAGGTSASRGGSGGGSSNGGGAGGGIMTCGAAGQPCCPDNSPCGSGLTCRDNGCQSIPTDGTGTSCTVDSDCPTGLCEFDSASDGPGVCTRSCSSPGSVCVPGWTCRAELGSLTNYECQCLDPLPETCNGLDDDCDGVVDDEPATDRGCVETKGIGYACRNGSCTCATTCGGACVDLQSDANNCGACGNRCAIACAAGQCTTPVGVSVGNLFACGVLSNGAVACWGGALGTTNLFERWTTPQTVEGVNNAIAVSAGGGHACALLADKTVACWGSNAAGQLGTTTAATVSPFPIQIPGLHDVTALASGENFICALHADKTEVCWGSDYYGQLGNGTTNKVPNPSPMRVPGLSGITAIAAANQHTCALLSDGTVSCWGLNDFGESGSGSSAEVVTSPTAVPGLTGVKGIATGWDHSCALLSDGTTACWGQDANRELGNVPLTSNAPTSATPVATPGVSQATAVAAFGDFTCVLYLVGTVGCWGANDLNELGDANWPNTVGGLSETVTALATGLESSCVLMSGGEIACWGDNSEGELGNGMISTSPPAGAVTVIWGN